MQLLIKTIYFSFLIGVFLSCDSSHENKYLLQTEDGKHLTNETKIFYLGIEVGQIDKIYFDNVKNKDFVFAEFHLTEHNILNSQSEIKWNLEGNLEITQGNSGDLLEAMDTVKMNFNPSPTKLDQNHTIKVTPINPNQILDNSEVDNLSSDEKQRLDSLKSKIDKLNNLIKEVNDEN